MERKKEFLIRVYLVVAGFVLVSIMMFSRAIQISYFQGEKWRAKVAEKYFKLFPIEAERGNILSDDGNPLAISLPYYEIRLDLLADGLTDKNFSQEVGEFAEKLSMTYNPEMSASQIKSWLVKERRKKNRYLLVARNLNHRQMEEIKEFPLLRLGQNKGGLVIVRKNRREKPYKLLANRTIGLHRDSFPIGLEGTYNQELKGRDGEKMMRLVYGGEYIPVQNVTEIESKKGKDIITNINIGIQEVAEEALLEAMMKHAADKGCAIVMEAKTGAIKAIANLGINESGEYSEDFNYAVAYSTEPGSTMKVASTMAMLETGKANIKTPVNLLGGEAYFYNEKMVDSEKHGVGLSDLTYAFSKSSNVGISRLAHDAFIHERIRFADYYQHWNLHKKSGIDLMGEPEPIMKHPNKNKKDWYGTTLPWMSIGYEMKMTPLQILSFYNAIANNGKMMKPFMVSQIRNEEKVVNDIKPKVVLDSMFSTNALQQIKYLLEEVVLTGTANGIKSDAYSIAGKTGTAVSNYFKSKDGSKEYQSSFCGYFPAEAPQYSVIVVIYNPKQGGYYGAAVAAPVFKKIADHCMRGNSIKAIVVNSQEKPSLNIENLPIGNLGHAKDFKCIFDFIGLPYRQEANTEWIRTVSDESGVVTMPIDADTEFIPNVIGMGLRDAMYILDKHKIQSRPHGVGKVRTQSIAPGEINYHTTIDLFLE